jgi:hypothetical protein
LGNIGSLTTLPLDGGDSKRYLPLAIMDGSKGTNLGFGTVRNSKPPIS